MIKRYILLHKNIRVAAIDIQGESIVNIVLSKHEQALKHMPVGAYSSVNLKEWVKERGIPATRQGISKDIRRLHVNSSFTLMLMNCGLSLTDGYWLLDANYLDKYTWESINLYTNPFKSQYTLDLVEGVESIVNKTNFVPSYSLKGDLRKKWIIDKSGERLLVKGNYSKTCRQSICEVFASEMHRLQSRFRYVPYSFIKISSDGETILGCQCPNFTTEDIEFIPAIDIINNKKKPNDISYYDFYISECEKQGVNVRSMLEYQIMTDFIISNTDRHLNNFGVLRDSNSLKWIGYAPIFDSGNSMFYKSSYIPTTSKGLLNLQVSSFLSKEVQLLRYITNRGLVNIQLLPNINYLYNLLKNDCVSSEDIDRTIKAYKVKIKLLSDFQNGANIWSYNYKG